MINKMKEYLKSEYDNDNHIKNFLIYWGKNSIGKGDKWRIKNDLDCLYLSSEEKETEQILKADTIVPMWAPIKMVAMYNSGCKQIVKDKCGELLKDYNKYFIDNDITKKLEKLAQLAEKRCNYMKLPTREMNRRGEMQLPATLYHCFEDGKFSKYFDDNFTEKEWIKEQRLECAFYEKEIDGIPIIERHNIKKIYEGLSPVVSVTKSTKGELIDALLDYSIELLEAREKILG